MNQDLGHWVTSIDIPEEIFGFVYRITNLENNKMYIGKKLCTSVKKLNASGILSLGGVINSIKASE